MFLQRSVAVGVKPLTLSKESFLEIPYFIQHSRFVTAIPHDSEDPDRELMEAVATGDHGAFRLLVERHQGLVIGTLARMLGTADAEDIAQQVFLRVWRSAPRWTPQAKVTTWIMTIARRLAFNESRRRGRSRILRQSEEDVGMPEGIEDPSASPDRRIEQEELRGAVESAMAELPERERMAVILRRHHEMPYEDIASVLGVSVPAVKSLLFRARNTLRQQLSAYLES